MEADDLRALGNRLPSKSFNTTEVILFVGVACLKLGHTNANVTHELYQFCLDPAFRCILPYFMAGRVSLARVMLGNYFVRGGSVELAFDLPMQDANNPPCSV